LDTSSRESGDAGDNGRGRRGAKRNGVPLEGIPFGNLWGRVPVVCMEGSEKRCTIFCESKFCLYLCGLLKASYRFWCNGVRENRTE